jgi:hypothetical protein
MAKNEKIEVQGTGIIIYKENNEDFISLTDIASYRDADRSDYILQNWMRNRHTIEFMGLWEQFNNPGFNSIEFDGIKNMAKPAGSHIQRKLALKKKWHIFQDR